MLSLFSPTRASCRSSREADTGYDPDLPTGSGPYYMVDYKPSIGFTLKRNPVSTATTSA